MSMSRPALPPLRTKLARHVLLPLGLVWLVGAAFAIAIAWHFTEAAFDRALLDDALGLAASVTGRHHDLRVRLSGDELRAVLFDQSEAVYFALREPDNTLVAGTPDLRVERRHPDQRAEFFDLQHRGEPVRAVALRGEQPLAFELVLAQTTRNRRQVLRELLLYTVTPQVLLLLTLSGWLRHVVQSDVEPIVALQSELNRRDAADLRPLGVRASTRDVASLTQSIDALMARLDASLLAQREFTGNVAHELRTPLAGIRAQADYALAHDDPALWRGQLQGIVRSQDRASRLVDQLLALALADEADSAPQLQAVALDEVVRRVLLQSMPRADAAGVDLGAEGIGARILVLGNEALIEGALQNLLDNALRYARPAAGEPARVTVDVVRDPDAVVLSVIDNGPGMPPPERERVVERWQQGRAGRRLGAGAGLGLAIVARYAQLLGGSFAIERSPRDGGTCARLRLQPASG